MGFPHQGVQTEATELPKEGPGFARFRPQGSANWGHPALVGALESAAARLARDGDTPPLLLGDLSAKRGGHIPRHKSHRTGRDVDLLWLVTSLNGTPVRSPGFVRIGPDGIGLLGADPVVRLDVPRQWRLVRALLTDPNISVQWMFCSEPIEALLIEQARALGEPDELVWRAETVLQQPADSLPHDDHIHLRVACSPEDMLRGCAGGGPQWEWAAPAPALPPLTRQDLEEIGRSDPFSLEPLAEVTASEAALRADSER